MKRGLCLLLALLLPLGADAAEKKKKKKKEDPKAIVEEKKKPPEPELPPPDVSKMADFVNLLSLQGKVSSRVLLSNILKDELTRSVIVPVVPQSGIDSLMEPLKCKKITDLCLGNIAAGLGSRYLVYGTVNPSGPKIGLELHLYDAKTPREIAVASGTLSGPADKGAMKATLAQLLAPAPELRPAEPADAQKKEPVIAEGSVLRRWWFWGLVGGVAAGGTAGGLILTARPPAPADSDLGSFDLK